LKGAIELEPRGVESTGCDFAGICFGGSDGCNEVYDDELGNYLYFKEL
jgi:hypothetical protein